jgi:DNA polymerase III delta prime subunit
MFEIGFKFVILDEVDYMTKNAQQALKTLLQTSNYNVRFCLVCNYISKIDESLQREFICVRFNQLPPGEIYKFIRRIADAEDLLMDSDDIELLMISHQSDIRSMINFMQSAYFDKNRKNNVKPVSGNEWKELTNLLITNDIQSSKNYITFISTSHNLNKKQILLGYMNYILRKRIHFVNNEILDIFEYVSHSSDDIPYDDLVSYFVTNVSEFIKI